MRFYYEELGVGREASLSDIKKAYRRAAMRWHPDRHQGPSDEATRRFKAIGEAYRVLSDAGRRMAYDAEIGSRAPPRPSASKGASSSSAGSSAGHRQTAQAEAANDAAAAAKKAEAAATEALVALAALMVARGYGRAGVVGALVGRGCADVEARRIAALFDAQFSWTYRLGRWVGDQFRREPTRSWSAVVAGVAVVAVIVARQPDAPLPAASATSTKALPPGWTVTKLPPNPPAPSQAVALASPSPAAFSITTVLPDYNAQTKTATFQFRSLPSSKPFAGYKDWTGKRLTGTLIGQPDLEGQFRVYYFSFISNPVDEFDCHACVPLVAGFMTRLSPQGEILSIPLSPLAPLGSFGQYAFGNELPKVVTVAPGKKALFLADGHLNQGYASRDATIVGIETTGFRYLGKVLTAASAEGSAACEALPKDSCENLAVSHRFGPELSKGYFVLKSEMRGRRFSSDYANASKVDEVKLSAFNGTDYPDPWRRPNE